MNNQKEENLRITFNYILIVLLFAIGFIDYMFTYLCFAWSGLNSNTTKLILSCIWILFLIIFLFKRINKIRIGDYISIYENGNTKAIQKKQYLELAKLILLNFITLYISIDILTGLNIIK